MAFELNEYTTATLTSITSRVERHGEDKVPAVSFGLTFEAPNTILDKLAGSLRETLYMAVPGQEELPNIEQATPLLRSKIIDALTVDGSIEGATLNVDHGIDDEEPIAFGGCKVDNFRVRPKEGGTVLLSLRIGTSDSDARKRGLMDMKHGQEIEVQILAPKLKQDAIDGSTDAFERDHPPSDEGSPFDGDETDDDATSAFVAAHGEGATA